MLVEDGACRTPDKLCGHITMYIKSGDLSRAATLNEATQRLHSLDFKNMSHFSRVPAFISGGKC